MRNNELKQVFFIKEHEENGEITIDSFPFIDEEKYNTFKEIRQLLRIDNYRIFEQKGSWVDELENHYIDHGLIKRLLKMNETENATKEGITFQSKRGFINYIIDDIIPIPSHADELINSLKREYTLFNEIPRYEQIIDYLKEIRELMRINESLPVKLSSLSNELEDLLNTWNMISITCKEIRYSLSSMEEEASTELTSIQNQLKEAIQRGEDLVSALKTTSLQYYGKLYRNYLKRLHKIEIEKKKEETLQEFFNLYTHIRESNEFKQRIDDLEERKRLELGPLQIKLDKLKKEFKEVLIQTYQYTQFQHENLKQESGKTTSKNTGMIEEKATYQAELRSLVKIRKELMDDLEKTNHEIEIFLRSFEPGLEFISALTRIETQIRQNKASIRKFNEQMNQFKQEIAELKFEQQTTEERKSDSIQVLERNQNLIQQITNKWGNLIRLEGFIQEYGSLSIAEPAYHRVSKQNQKRLEDKILKITNKIFNITQETDLIIPKLEYYEAHESFPANKEIETIISFLHEQGVVAHRGWEYYDKNRTIIDKKWIENYPFLFEGIIAQDDSLQKIKEVLDDLDIFAEFPIYITQSSLFSKESFISEVKDKCLFLEKSVIWKYDPKNKDIYYQTLAQKRIDLEKDLKTNKSKLKLLNELKEDIQEFLQFADEKKYLSYQKSINEEQTEIRELEEAINTLSTRIVGRENQLKSIKDTLSDVEQSLLQWQEEERKSRELKIKNSKIVKNGQEISLLSKKIPEYKSMIRDLEEERIPEIRKKLENLADQILTKRSSLDQLAREYQILFTDKLVKTPSSNAPQKLVTDAKTRYMMFKDTFDDNQTIKEFDKLIFQLMDQRNLKEEIVDKGCEIRKIDRTIIDQLWHKFRNRPNQIPSLSESNRERISELIRKEQRTNGRKNKVKTKINELEQELNEDVKESPFSLRELKYRRENLDQEIAQVNLLEDSLRTYIDELEDRIETITQLEEHEKRLSDNISTNSPLYVSLYEEFQEKYYPGDIHTLSFDKKSIESINALITKLEQKETRLNSKRQEITKMDSIFNQKRSKFFEEVQRLVRKGQQISYLKNYDVVVLLSNLEILQIPTMDEECENDIVQRERELEERKRKLKTQVDLLQGELVKCFEKIKQFQYTKINIQSNESFTGYQPIKIQYNFNLGEVSELIHGFLNVALTGLHIEEEFPQEWLNYHSLIKSLMSQFLIGKIKEIRFLLPHGDKPTYSNFEQFMLMSGGQTATIAIILYCYIAHYKIKYKRRMFYQDFELVEKIPLSFPFISDNPIGNANLEELVRLQLDVAKSLNVQMIYFSGIKELGNIEEFETVIPMLQSANSTVYIPDEEKFIVQKGPTLHHMPIREETVE